MSGSVGAIQRLARATYHPRHYRDRAVIRRLYGGAFSTPGHLQPVSGDVLKLLELGFEACAIPITLAAIVGLFAIQRFDTEVMDTLFGCMMPVCFLIIDLLGAC